MAQGETVSAALIVKNEQANLAKCLRSLRGKVDEIVIVDTGSTDDTRRIAQEYTPKVFKSKLFNEHTEVVDFHFGEARNEALDKCSYDWILSIDADEIVNGDGLRDYIDASKSRLYNVWLTGGTRLVRVPRVFRRDPDMRWRNRVHEQPGKGQDGKAAYAFMPQDVMSIHHEPGTTEHSLKRYQRNILLLKRQLINNENVGHAVMQIAQTYGAIGPHMGLEALGHYFAYYLNADPDSNYRSQSIMGIVTSLINVGLHQLALPYAEEFARCEPNCPEAWTLLSDIYVYQGKHAMAMTQLAKAMAIEKPTPPIMFTKATINREHLAGVYAKLEEIVKNG